MLLYKLSCVFDNLVMQVILKFCNIFDRFWFIWSLLQQYDFLSFLSYSNIYIFLKIDNHIFSDCQILKYEKVGLFNWNFEILKCFYFIEPQNVSYWKMCELYFIEKWLSSKKPGTRTIHTNNHTHIYISA